MIVAFEVQDKNEIHSITNHLALLKLDVFKKYFQKK